jgi:methylthioribose-1-phosphate isomerase
VPIEQRDDREVTEIIGQLANGEITSVRISPADTAVANYAFDVTPARLVTGLITERAIIDAQREAIARVYPDHP